MSLERFKLPAPDTRLFIHRGTIYKLKLSYKYSPGTKSAFLPCRPRTMQLEVEQVLRAVLHTDNKLQPLKTQTEHFLIDCKFVPWATSKKLRFEDKGKNLPAHDEMIVITVQPNSKEVATDRKEETGKDEGSIKAAEHTSTTMPKSSRTSMENSSFENVRVIPETPERPDASTMKKIVKKNNLTGSSARRSDSVPRQQEIPVNAGSSGANTKSSSFTRKQPDTVRSRVVKRRHLILAQAIEDTRDRSSDEEVGSTASQEITKNGKPKASVY